MVPPAEPGHCRENSKDGASLMGSFARISERSFGFQMERAQSPRSSQSSQFPTVRKLPRRWNIVDRVSCVSLKSRMSSARLSRRPSQRETTPEGVMCGCASLLDSLVVWKARKRSPTPSFYICGLPRPGRKERASLRFCQILPVRRSPVKVHLPNCTLTCVSVF